MMERPFPRLSLIFLLLLSVLSCTSVPDSAGDARPNIIFIMADDLGYAELGSYGQELIETPNIDALAQEGMRFRQHYSGSPVCAPSRCVLLTGKHTGHAYIRGNDEWGDRGDVWDFAKAVDDPNLEGQRPIPSSTETLGKVLQQAQYKTAIVGKWGLGGPLTEGIPNQQGFDFFSGYNCQRQAHTYYPKHLWRNTEKIWLENELVVPGTKLDEGADPNDPASYAKFTQPQFAPKIMLEDALQFIEGNKGNPFFLYFASPIPHNPLQAPERWVQYYIEKFGPEEPYLGDRGYFPHRNPHAAYAAMVSYLDEQVGQLMDKLRELGIYENTIVFFTSDNGPTYSGGADSQFFDSAKPFKSDPGWGKGSLHEGGIRVPMIVSWPGRIQSGTTSDHISAFYDIMPTLSEIAGASIKGPIDGISFLPTLLGSGDQKGHEFLYWEFPSYGGQQAVRMGDWKGLRTEMLEGNLDIALFNLRNDPQEQENIAEQHPEIVEKIRLIMEQEHIPSEIDRFKFEHLGD
jgi:arylsulfatase